MDNRGAILAENGFIGNRYILDGDNSFWIMAGSDRFDYEKKTAGLGSNNKLQSLEHSFFLHYVQ